MKTLVALTVLSLSAAGWAASTTQPARKDKPDPANAALSKPAIGADAGVIRNTLLPPRPEEPIQPLAPFDPKPESSAPVGGAPIREGTYIVDRMGTLSKQPDGQQQFEFTSDGHAIGELPMLALPNLNLLKVESAMKKSSGRLRFCITGEITEYHGRNYILIRKAENDKPAAPNSPPAKPTTAKAAPAKPSTGADAEVILNALLPPRREEPIQPLPPEPRTYDAQPVAPGPVGVALIREGTPLVDRMGTLSKQPDGQQQFEFTSDGKALGAPPVLALPNLNLMQMEGALKQASGHLRFRVTGEVTEYNGRNYILIKKFVIPDSNNPLRPMPKQYDFSEAR